MNEITSAVAGRPARNSLSIALSQLDSGIIDPAGSRAIQICDAADTMLAALQHTKRLLDEALPKFNWGASALDSNAIRLLNEVPRSVAAAIATATGIAERAQAVVANATAAHGTAILDRPSIPRAMIFVSGGQVIDVLSDAEIDVTLIDWDSEGLVEGVSDALFVSGIEPSNPEKLALVDRFEATPTPFECDRIQALVAAQS